MHHYEELSRGKNCVLTTGQYGHSVPSFNQNQRKFVKLKKMESDNADQFLIFEFRCYDFEVLANVCRFSY